MFFILDYLDNATPCLKRTMNQVLLDRGEVIQQVGFHIHHD